MLGLPPSTEFNKRIPKQKFYEELNISSSLKHIFKTQILAIYWRNKIASTTTNLAQGKTVEEIEIFEIDLTAMPLPEDVLRQIDRCIPYHIVFLLKYEDRYQAWTAYKEKSPGKYAFKVGLYYRTDWLYERDLPIRIDGRDVDGVYENFVRQIGNKHLQKQDKANETLKDSVERDERRQELKKQIEKLERKIRNEKQLNRQIEMNEILKRLRATMETL